MIYYMAVQDWIHVIFLYCDIFKLTDPLYTIKVRFFESAVHYMSLGIPFMKHVALISFANPALPYVFTVYPVLWSINFCCLDVHNVRHNYASMV